MHLNLKLLKRLYLIDHSSGEEHDMISFILNYCYKIPKLTFSIDKECNLFITKNTTNPKSYPCVVAHMDTIQTFYSAREIVISNNIATAHYINTGSQCGLNADDCCGILVALQLLETIPNLKVCFTTKEEIGGIGAYQATENIGFFSNVRYLLQADRRGSSDLITHTNGIDSADPEFVKDIEPLMKKYGYAENSGTFTDVGILAENLLISGVNISCGYYGEHTFRECCDLKELNNCLNFMHDIILLLNKNDKMYHIEVPANTSITSAYNYYGSTTTEETPPYENLPCDHCMTQDCMRCKYTHVF